VKGGSCVRPASAVLIAVGLAAVSMAAQSLSAPVMKAAYLLNFARFVEWPAEMLPNGSPLMMCVVNDAAVATALEQTIKGRAVNGHPLSVIRSAARATLPVCHVLFLGASDQKGSRDMIAALGERLVLTVSDAPRFAMNGGMIELLIQDGKLRMIANVDALHRANVRLSSRVLTIATIVRDNPAE
jgi:hypothetical protein